MANDDRRATAIKGFAYAFVSLMSARAANTVPLAIAIRQRFGLLAARSARRRCGLVVPGTLALLTAACAAGSGSPRSSTPQEGTTTAVAIQDRPERRASSRGPPRAPTPLSSDPLWQRAARGDVIDLTELADREGAGGLFAGVELGGTVGLTALSALPHAEDAEIALGPLCNLATRMPPERVAPVLVAIQAILRRPPRPTERLDAEGLAGLPSRSAAARDLRGARTRRPRSGGKLPRLARGVAERPLRVSPNKMTR